MVSFKSCILIAHINILLFLIFYPLVQCEKILGIFPSVGYSQFILAEKLMSSLAERGHEVTMISVYKPKEEVKNLRTVLFDFDQTNGDISYDLDNLGIFSSHKMFYDYVRYGTEATLSDKNVQNLIKSNETFDLVIIEQFGNDAHLGFAIHFKSLLISFSSIGLGEWSSHLVGNVRLPSIVPLTVTSFSSRMNFWERLQNFIIHVYDLLYKHYVYYPEQQELLNKYFPNEINLEEAINNVSLLLTNSHVTTTDPILLTNAVVEIGGFHITQKKLPEDIQRFLDDAKHGAIFFSLGSNLKATNLPKGKLEEIIRVFSKMKQRIIWKFESNDIPNKPSNLYVSKWLPQTDILAHPNVMVFITHCGLLSTTEAIHFGVPMIGIPIFGDQKMNLKRTLNKEIIIHLPFSKLSGETLAEALDEILNNPSYKNKAEKLSKINQDRLVHPLNTSMYWIEHIIRHGGGAHLRNISAELNWIQLYSLDVIIVLFALTYLILYLIKQFWYCCSGKYVKTVKLKNN